MLFTYYIRFSYQGQTIERIEPTLRNYTDGSCQIVKQQIYIDVILFYIKIKMTYVYR